MRKPVALTAAILCLSTLPAAFAQENVPPPGSAARPAAGAPADAGEYRQQVSYALGRNFAHNLRDNEIDVDLQALLAGVSDLLTGARPRWTDEQLEPTMQRFTQEMQQKAESRFQQMATKNQREAEAFLAQNAQREGVQTTASGLQYRVLREGDGPSPTLNDTVRCNYRGVLLNGTEFDSSARQGGPLEIPVSRVIPGWREALQKMRVGDRWQLFIPGSLAYGMNPPGPPIEPNSLLVFDIELMGIVGQ